MYKFGSKTCRRVVWVCNRWQHVQNSSRSRLQSESVPCIPLPHASLSITDERARVVHCSSLDGLPHPLSTEIVPISVKRLLLLLGRRLLLVMVMLLRGSRVGGVLGREVGGGRCGELPHRRLQRAAVELPVAAAAAGDRKSVV